MSGTLPMFLALRFQCIRPPPAAAALQADTGSAVVIKQLQGALQYVRWPQASKPMGKCHPRHLSPLTVSSLGPLTKTSKVILTAVRSRKVFAPLDSCVYQLTRLKLDPHLTEAGLTDSPTFPPTCLGLHKIIPISCSSKYLLSTHQLNNPGGNLGNLVPSPATPLSS